MIAALFRRVALEIDGAEESTHMDHPDFRIAGKIFASLGYPDDAHGMVKLTADQQRVFCAKAPSVFTPCAGAWGKQGSTKVLLPHANADLVRAALRAASDHISSKGKKT